LAICDFSERCGRIGILKGMKERQGAIKLLLRGGAGDWEPDLSEALAMVVLMGLLSPQWTYHHEGSQENDA
jgi:hypothetical protein